MYTFSQLLLKNIGLALIFIVSISVISIAMLSSFFENKTEEHLQIIQTFTQQIEVDENQLANATNIINSLQKIASYNRLVIYDLAGKSLANYHNEQTGFTFPIITPAMTQVQIDKFTIIIEYQLNFHNESVWLLTFIIISTLLTLFFVFFAVSMSSKRQKKMFDVVGQQIKMDLALINHTSAEDDEGIEVDKELLEIPELKEAIANIKLLMAKQLENVNNLEQVAYVDQVTQLENRARFVQFYETQIKEESRVKFGVFSITRCSELQTVNQIHGYKEGDRYISHVASLIKKALTTFPNANIFRLNGSDFACILPNVTLKQAENLSKNLTSLFNEYQLTSELESIAYTGLVSFDKSKPLGELLALADTGISIAQTQAPNSWYAQTDSDVVQQESTNYGNQSWQQEINNVIENQRIVLLTQSVQPNGHNNKVYAEVLARFHNSNKEILPTSSFIAMAEKLDKITAIDKLIIESTINEINNKNLLEHRFGINLSSRSISDEHFMIWLERKLLREPKVAPKLIFEISEHGLQQNINTSKRLIDMLHRVGSRVTVERFGVGLTSFKFFRDLKPDYIKMDSSYTRNIDNDKNNQYFLRLMVDLAHRLSIKVLAESVETQEEKHTLENLLLDGCQGFYIGKPKPF